MSETHAETTRFVRESMLPEATPPASEMGALKWVRENLFSSVLNGVLTVLSVLFVIWVLWTVLPWMLGGVWEARSLNDCRDVLFAFGRDPAHGGACWAVIEDRFLQLLFGFYPPELYWRPILAFVLMFVALAPILFADRLPSQLMYFSLLYPFIAVWLIWGGSFWAPLLVIVGFIVAYVAFAVLSRVTISGLAVAGAIVASVAWWGYGSPYVSDQINRSIGESRFEEALAENQALMADLPGQIDEAEANVDALDDQLASVAEERDALFVRIEAVRSEQLLAEAEPELEALIAQRAAIEDETSDEALELDSDIARVEQEIEELTDHIAAAENIPSESELPALREELLDYQTVLAELTDARFAALAIQTALTNDRSNARQRVGSLESLPEEEESLPDLLEQIEAAEGPVDETRRLYREARSAFDDAYEPFVDALTAVYGASPVPEQESRTWTEREALDQARDERAPEALQAQVEGLEALQTARDEAERAFEDAEEALSDLEQEYAQTRAAIQTTYADLALTGLEPVQSRQIGGFMLAIIIGLAGIVLSFPLGIALALGRQSDLIVLKGFSVGFIEIIRGVPLIVWLFTAQLLLNYFLPPGTNFDLMLRVIIMVTLFASAYMAEVIRGGLAALPRGQYEGADSLGLDYWQSMRLIILPQALKISIPGIVNTFIGLFKDTVLVVFIGLLDPIGLSNAIRASSEWNGIYWELFIFIGLCFWIFCYAMSRYSQGLERRLATDRR